MDLLTLLTRSGHLGAAQVSRLRVRGTEPLVARVVAIGAIGEDALADLLSREARTVVIDLDRGALEREAVLAVPEAVARAHLAIAVARDPDEHLRVALADPLDRAAVSAFAKASGCQVRAMVATVSSVRRAIDREYGASRDRSQSSGSEMIAEATKRMRDSAGLVEVEEGTAPAHRIESEASADQRVEALVLALIERGVITRSEYAAALKRLLGRE